MPKINVPNVKNTTNFPTTQQPSMSGLNAPFSDPMNKVPLGPNQKPNCPNTSIQPPQNNSNANNSSMIPQNTNINNSNQPPNNNLMYNMANLNTTPNNNLESSTNSQLKNIILPNQYMNNQMMNNTSNPVPSTQNTNQQNFPNYPYQSQNFNNPHNINNSMYNNQGMTLPNSNINSMISSNMNQQNFSNNMINPNNSTLSKLPNQNQGYIPGGFNQGNNNPNSQYGNMYHMFQNQHSNDFQK